MTISRVEINPDYCLFYLAGTMAFDAPIHIELGQILGTDSCISVPCYPGQHGPTTIILGPRTEIVAVGTPKFVGAIHTPDRLLHVVDVDGTEHLATATRMTRTKVTIWTNHPTAPSVVTIAFD